MQLELLANMVFSNLLPAVRFRQSLPRNFANTSETALATQKSDAHFKWLSNRSIYTLGISGGTHENRAGTIPAVQLGCEAPQLPEGRPLPTESYAA